MITPKTQRVGVETVLLRRLYVLFFIDPASRRFYPTVRSTPIGEQPGACLVRRRACLRVLV